jgi:hypothetical protein
MSHSDAHKILDRVREGVAYPEHVITMALKLTGDIHDD